jgi:tetratricopeptide (TPR) repeat protein
MINNNQDAEFMKYNRAITSQWLGEYFDALVDYSRLDFRNIKYNTTAMMNLGLIFSYLYLYEEAIAIYMLYTPKNMILFYNIIVVIYRSRGIDFSRDMIIGAIKFFPADQTIADHEKLYGIAGLYAMLKEKTMALSFLRNAVQIDNIVRLWAYHDIAWHEFRDDLQFLKIIGSVE